LDIHLRPLRCNFSICARFEWLLLSIYFILLFLLFLLLLTRQSKASLMPHTGSILNWSSARPVQVWRKADAWNLLPFFSTQSCQAQQAAIATPSWDPGWAIHLDSLLENTVEDIN
jgi:hypothetical protein